MKIIGIDPGLANTGYGIIKAEGARLVMVTSGAIATSAKLATPERLKIIFSRIKILVEEFKPEAGAVEDVFVSRNIKTSFLLGQAKAAATVAVAAYEIPVFDYSASSVKQGVTGYGRADKKQVQIMVMRLLNLPQIPRPDHAADALAVALCHFNSHHLSSRIASHK
ncbi:MAG: crossover junction endodeoxyribonuclease RuvC [bacterium]